MAKATLGIPRFNIHRIEKTLDADNKITHNSKLEFIVSVKDGITPLQCTISGNEATITHEGYSEGDTVIMWVTCTRPSEDGGICEQNYVQADEDTWQDYLDLL